MIRWLKFNAVGAMGIVVQLAVLSLLKSVFHVHYLVATALAVEAAILHNYFWHEQWTWVDRGRRPWALLRFNVSTGAVSILSNLLCMWVLVGRLRLHYLIANLLSIAVASVANFLMSDRLIFRRGS